MLGILTLDTAFPRIRGDVGCPATFDFPVRIRTVAGATVDELVHRRDDGLLPGFAAAGRALAAEGCLGIATTCGFLARWQHELTAALPVPVLTSSLVLLPLVARLLPQGRRVGVVTYSAGDLPAELLVRCGAPADTPVAGIDPDGPFARAIRFGSPVLDVAAMRDETVGAARRLQHGRPDIGAILLECANMPPYRDAVASATDLPVFDASDAVRWFHAGLARTR